MSVMKILRGIPASGKSTWATEWAAEAPGRVRSNRDDLRFSRFGKYVLTHEEEDRITQIQHAEIEANLSANFDVTVDDTNLRASTVKSLLKIAEKVGATVEHRDFYITLDEALRRNKARGEAGERSVPEGVVRQFYDRYIRKGQFPKFPTLDTDIRPMDIVPFEQDETLPDIYMFDIDGTLAQGWFDKKIPGRRKPYDWSRVGEDDPIWGVLNVAKTFHEAGIEVIVMSGRDAVCRPETMAWLETHLGWAPQVFMRPEGDMRSDVIVKNMLFNQHIRGRYNVLGVFDDRLQVCELWEKMELTLFRVGPLNSNF